MSAHYLIDLFKDAATSGIPTTATAVRTSGHSELGKGAADYVYDSTLTSTYVTANLLTSFLVNNRVYRLARNQRLNIYQFGVTGSGTLANDDSAALRAALLMTSENKATLHLDGARVRASVSLVDEDVDISGPGTLVQMQAKELITVLRSWSPNETAVSGIQPALLGEKNSLASPGLTRVNKIKCDASKFKADDVLALTSQDKYPWNQGVYQGTLIKVHAVGLDYEVPSFQSGIVYTQYSVVENNGILYSLITSPTMAAGAAPTHASSSQPYDNGYTWLVVPAPFTEGNNFGTSSGGLGLIQSLLPMLNGSGDPLPSKVGTIIMRRLSGTFLPGDSLIGGIGVKATLTSQYYLTVDLFENGNTYSNGAILNRLPTSKVSIKDVDLDAESDTDAIVTKANRQPAIRLGGVIEPRITARVRNSWTRAVSLHSCWSGVMDLSVDKLPNNAAETEAAYGYLLELADSCHGVVASVNGCNVRHGITTNSTFGHTTLGFAKIAWEFGEPKYCLIHDSVLHDCYAEAFDTHSGGWGLTFANCKSINNGGMGKYLTNPAGFVNRCFNTTYRDCEAINCTYGFIDQSSAYPTADGVTSTTRFIDCSVDNFGNYGIQLTGTSFMKRFIIQGGTIRGDGSLKGQPFNQAGLRLDNNAVVSVNGTRFERINYAHTWIAGDNTRAELTNVVLDFTQSPNAGIDGFRFQTTGIVTGGVTSTLADLSVFHPTVIRGPGSDLPNSIIRWVSPAPVTIKVAAGIASQTGPIAPVMAGGGGAASLVRYEGNNTITVA